MTRDQLIETMARALTSEWTWACALETDEESQRYFEENSHTKEFEYSYGPNRSRDSYRKQATAALAAIEAAGMRVVPVEATGKMVSYGAHMVTGLCAAVCCHVTGGHGGPRMHPHCECREAAPKVYRAMIHAFYGDAFRRLAQEDSTSE